MATSTKTDLKVEASVPVSVSKVKKSIIDRVLKQLSSVRFGIVLLVILIFFATTGMIIEQVTVEGFDKYYLALSPAQKAMGADPILQLLRNLTGRPFDGWNILNFFDIYRSYAFISLIAVLALNIILASIDRFPSAWKFIKHKKLSASKMHALTQPNHATLPSTGEAGEPERVAGICKSFGLKPTITREAKRVTVFAERNSWNRLTAYAVHVALMVIFTSGFLTWRFAYTGSVVLEPGSKESAMRILDFQLADVKANRPLTVKNVPLPFVLECTDIQQTLLDPKGGLDSQNTVDWFTRVKIEDGSGATPAEIHMNKPYDYKGYRFFQQSYEPVANARSVVLEVQHPNGSKEDITLKKRELTKLADGTALGFFNFVGDLQLISGKPQQVSTEYHNPGAVLGFVSSTGAEPKQVIAFTESYLQSHPEAKALATFGDATAVLKDYERVGSTHTLSVQYDPGSRVFYLGSVMLILTLVAVFFFQHQRVWFVFEEEDGKRQIYAGGNTNRNRTVFEQKFNELLAAINPAAPQRGES